MLSYGQVKLIGSLVVAIPLALHTPFTLPQAIDSVAHWWLEQREGTSRVTKSDQFELVFGEEIRTSCGDYSPLSLQEALDEKVEKRRAWYDESLELLERARHFGPGPPSYTQ